MNKFTCKKCGSVKLGYKKFVKCITPVVISPDGKIEYLQSTVDEDNYIWAENSFICLTCGEKVTYCGCDLKTEDELIDYLSKDKEEIEIEEKEYQELLEAEIYLQEQKDKEVYCPDEVVNHEII